MFLELQIRSTEARDDSRPALVPERSYCLAGVSTTAELAWDDRMRGDIARLTRASDRLESWHRLVDALQTFLAELEGGIDAAVVDAAEARGEQVVVDIVTDSPEISLLPWESAPTQEARTYLSDFTNVVVRYSPMELPAMAPLDKPEHPGVLLAWSDAGGPVPAEALADTLRAATREGGVAFCEVSEVDEARLHAALEEKPVSVVHLLCRPARPRDGASMSFAWGTKEAPSIVSITDLARLLGPHAQALRLVVIDVCDGPRPGSESLCHGLAEPLLHHGVPAVLGARAPRTPGGSLRLARSLYPSLLSEGGSLEHATRHARIALLAAGAGDPGAVGAGHGLQLHMRSREFVKDQGGAQATRPIPASYPFGTARQPTPAHQPHQETEIELSSGVKRAHKVSKRIVKKLERRAKNRSRADRSALKRAGQALRESGTRTAARARALTRLRNLSRTAIVIALGIGTALASVALQRLFFAESEPTQVPAEPVLYARDTSVADASVIDAPATQAAAASASSKNPDAAAAADANPGKAPEVTPDARPAATPAATRRKAPAATRRTKKRTPTPAPADASRPDEPALGRVWVAIEALYDIESKIARITWRVPVGAAGVLVVKSTSRRIRGKPTPGTSYTPGAPWPGSSGASIHSVGTQTQADFQISPGETIWLHFWAFDKNHHYGPGRPFEWTVPHDLEHANP